MSNHFKSSLLAASAIIAAGATTAQAQIVYPAADLHGAGASSIQDILPREANCVGGFAADSTHINATAASSGAFGPRTAVAVEGSTAKFNCATQSVQPNLTLRYVSVGSTGGRNAFLAPTKAALQATSGTNNLFGSNTRPEVGTFGFGSTTTDWTMTHFAMSDAPATAGNVSSWSTARTTAGNVGYGAGALIQIPVYVLPMAVAYKPAYAVKVDASGNAIVDASGNPTGALNLNVVNLSGVSTTPVLKLSKQAYCAILNGNIKNWNHVEIARANNAGTIKAPVITPLFDPVNDTAARWASEGAPIRLVGRLDGSGSTDIFVRHLAAACYGSVVAGLGTTKFSSAGEQIPYVPGSSPDMTDAATAAGLSTSSLNYKPTQTDTTKFSGTVNMVSGLYFTGSAFGAVSGAITDPAASATGTNGSGLYLLASGGGNVAKAVANITAAGALIPANGTAKDGSAISFNGKIGYMAADTIVANPSLGLVAAALEAGHSFDKGNGKKPVFASPTAANATLAFGKVLPPESDSKGNYVPIASPLTNDLLRTDPLAWYAALYANLSTLADPTVGYPITGTTQFNTGTCFADPATRNGVVTLLRTMLGLNLKDSAGKAVDKTLFLGSKAPLLSVRAQNGLANLPTAWINAINNTFLQRGDAKNPGLADKNLYIQNGLPTEKFKTPKVAKGYTMTPADLAGIVNTGTGATAVYPLGAANPTCTAAQGIAAL